MNLRSIRALFGLTSSFVLVAACTAPGGEQDESEGEDTAEVKQLMTGVQREPSGGIVKILVPNGTGTTVRTGVLIATNKVLTGLDAIPAGVNMASLLVSAPGEGSFAVASRADNYRPVHQRIGPQSDLDGEAGTLDRRPHAEGPDLDPVSLPQRDRHPPEPFGCSSSSGNTCSVTMNGAKNVTVKFVGCTGCYDDCFDACVNAPGGLSTPACISSCQTKCKGCGFQ